ncbi:amidohydrolase [Clostridium acetobutylicum]|uniref:IAA-like amino acid hydrolase n=1 Tax=Clostridium acetobutylicum (strain ATCC 824 / DSM 792 / JCM 1419 / IAM 19013 / LMG 5710 / NBRC 13948 / NRRL B-527 / VKM B-1787 / 2291 / W) TaxID=272562 RepID=Q97KA5_CLOAB|nr:MULTISPECIES: M20 family metallopeptidase [Clostridium]AAK78990.1 IAA-like amino acid hydrolase [Clostridium acetobutylicum ATCC 824]ADZ20065.1 IAA-like amino acid hydrolase [Clostridium acetobutylicum EA 2018]AEI31556.1 IAA-like amino acid hydrolase [Clostridium acetobutylicum DSM 1731]AWV81753.1 amidohydrolase [Clostridium acetobutylicum]KHD35629.1 peptidase M20 [Clostridium acetobutylicum]
MNYIEEAKVMYDELVAIRRDFHEHPELGFELERTSSKVKEFLKNEGIEYYETAKTGICAIIRGKNTGKTVGLRGDMDALPLMENNENRSYCSKVNGRMHACGHDAHTTILMGAAKLLNKMKDELQGNVKLFFEPAEETTGGAQIMIEEGVLENPHVDAVIGLHVSEDIECGKIGIKKGVVNAASNPFTITIKGRGAHGAHPNAGVDPIVAACNIVNMLQTLVSREISPVNPAVLTIGYIHGGTTAQNVIPEDAKIGGIIRTMKKEDREFAKKRLKEMVEGAATAMRTSASIDIEESYPCLYNDDNMFEMFKSLAKNLLKEENVIALDEPSMGVESFAYFSMERPSVFYYLGARNEEKGIVNPAHGSLFDVDEDCLPIGVALQCKAAVETLERLINK